MALGSLSAACAAARASCRAALCSRALLTPACSARRASRRAQANTKKNDKDFEFYT